MRTLFLIGFMGSGKTSVGETLGEKLGIPVLDTDKLIEEKYNQKISGIFKDQGEETFRMYEKEILIDLPYKDCVVSTGGGIVENTANIDFMKKHGYIIYLQTAFEEIERRLKNDTTRPLWNSGDKKSLFQKRQNLYKKDADIVVQTDIKTTEQIACEILNRLEPSE